MTLVQYLLLFLAVLIGGGIGFKLPYRDARHLKLILAFSGAFLLGIAVLHLMPAVYVEQKEAAGLWILLGFFIQLALEQLSTGVEHGHVHTDAHAPKGFAVQVMIGLSLHAFLEGMPLSGYQHIHEMALPSHSHNHLLYAVVLHKAPAAFALVILLLGSGFTRQTALLCLLCFAAMSPAGALFTHLAGVKPHSFSVLLAVVIGSFLHIATTILFESGGQKDHKMSRQKLVVILAGVGVSLLTLIH
jgi:zinc transporter ZupT